MQDAEDRVDAPAGAASPLAADLVALGFRAVARSHGHPTWLAGVNRFLQFQLQEEADAVVVTWRFDLGEFMLARGWQIGGAEASSQELYPQRDVRVPATVEAVAAEIRRTLANLRLDLGDPEL